MYVAMTRAKMYLSCTFLYSEELSMFLKKMPKHLYATTRNGTPDEEVVADQKITEDDGSVKVVSVRDDRGCEYILL